MKQLDIFDFCEAHHGGNENSREAFTASRPTAAEARKRILAFIQSRGAVGSTCDEVEQALNLPHQTASARCTELKASKKVVVIGKRKTRTGSPADVLAAVQGSYSHWRDE